MTIEPILVGAAIIAAILVLAFWPAEQPDYIDEILTRVEQGDLSRTYLDSVPTSALNEFLEHTEPAMLSVMQQRLSSMRSLAKSVLKDRIDVDHKQET